MPKRNGLIPKAIPLKLVKSQVLDTLLQIDASAASWKRISIIESNLRKAIQKHIESSVCADAKLSDFRTSPYVLLIHSAKHKYSNIFQLEKDILPAKEFSSMETSAGKMIEKAVLPVYGWDVESVESSMHSSKSSLDGELILGKIYKALTLKSGPACLNDEMSENFADNVHSYAKDWLNTSKTRTLEYTYGVLYGTFKQSNKKDWHILRNIVEKCHKNPGCSVIVNCDNSRECRVKIGRFPVNASIKVGLDLWNFIGGPLCLSEIAIAMIRACITPATEKNLHTEFTISDLGSIISIPESHKEINSKLLQRSQIPWFLFFLYHFYDQIED